MQQRNYQREMDALIASLDARPRLLLHSCCGPCSSACLERLAPHFDIDVFFYNPNILPAEEWEKRLFWQKHLLETAPFGKNVGLIVPERDETAFRLAAAGLEAEAEGGARCTECFVLRLSRTAEAARETGLAEGTPGITGTDDSGAEAISAGVLQPGDLIFYANSSGTINHVAMYIGGGRVIHASSPKTGIKISKYNYRTPVKYVNILRD